MKKLLVSACLLGTPCRYDGKSKPCQEVIKLSEKYELVPVCPEVLGGLETPRKPAEINGDKVIRIDGKDVTKEYLKGAKIALDIARENGIDVAILKSKSPSCSNREIYDGTYKGKLINGKGITAKYLLENGILVLDEGETYKL